MAELVRRRAIYAQRAAIEAAKLHPGIITSPVPAPLLKVEPVLYVPSKVGSSRVDLQACKLEYSIVSPK